MGNLLEIILWLLPDTLISILFGGGEREQETRIVPPPAEADDDLA
ncbi:hypothetical protein [uncultured Sphingobium sp.]|nr:hypothetical protein [uncultured Sphingobium sp.]